MRSSVRTGILAAVVCGARSSFAQAPAEERTPVVEPEEDEPPGQRNIGIGPTVGVYHANGIEALVGTQDIAAVISGGYTPLLVAALRDDGQDVDFNLVSSFQLDADLSVRIFNAGKTLLGAQPGYRYNTALGSGVAIGGFAARDFGEVIQLRVYYGLIVYPNGTDTLRERDEYAGDDVEFGVIGPALQGGLSLTLMLYP